MLIIGYDPGICSGYAVLLNGKYVESGTWLLLGHRISKQRDTPGSLIYPRVTIKMCNLVDKYIEKYDKVILAYEKVANHMGTNAAHIYGGLVACGIHTVSHARPSKVAEYPIHVGTWKKNSMGEGSGRFKMKQYVPKIREMFPMIDRTLSVTNAQDECAALGVARAAWEMRDA